jgi:hypothetical protein
MYCGVNEREPSLGDTRPVAELEVAIEVEVEVAVAVEVEVAVAGAVAANPALNRRPPPASTASH